MPRISTFLTAITLSLSLALGLLALPGNAQAGHKSDDHYKVKWDDDWDDRKGHGYRKYDRDDDHHGYKHGHKKRHKHAHKKHHKKHHKHAHKKHHKKHHKHAHKKHHKHGHKHAHGHGHGHGHHHHGKRYRPRDAWVNGFRVDYGGFFGQFQEGLRAAYGGCHKVSKIGYRNRQKALIGGTACYDRYGNLYIVDGSRYVIRYLNDEWH